MPTCASLLLISFKSVPSKHAVLTLASPRCRSYYAPIGIGVPAQYLNCILDTGCVARSSLSLPSPSNMY